MAVLNTPIGVLENKETFGLASEERPGILLLLGRQGYGKSVALENIIISDIQNGRGGMLIDPFGDLVLEIQAHISAERKNKIAVFEARGISLEENIERCKEEIHFSEMAKDSQKFLLCKIDYKTLGVAVARELGMYLTKHFLHVVGGKNRTLAIDEAHNFVDEDILEKVVESREKELSCILADQTSFNYRADIFERLAGAVNHVVSYCVDKPTAEIISKHHPELLTEDLASVEKYNFYVKLNAKTATPFVTKAKGIFPIPE